MEWIFTSNEEYLYITIRTIVVQVISLLFLFLFVHKPDDVNAYAGLTVFSLAAVNVANYVRSRKYCNLRFTINIEWNEYLKPILVFFGTTIATTVYISSDTTILGFLCDDYTVGLYSSASKIYSMLKGVLYAATAASVPRMAALWSENKVKEFKKLGEEIYALFLTLTIPAVFGLYLIAKEIITVLAGPQFFESYIALRILGFSLFFSLGAGFWSNAILVAVGEEKKILKITIISAIINFILNLVLIPSMKEKAAAITTLISEVIVFVYCKYQSNKHIIIEGEYQIVFKCFVGCLPILAWSILLHRVVANTFVCVGVLIGLSVISYIIVEYILGNDAVLKVINRDKQ